MSTSGISNPIGAIGIASRKTLADYRSEAQDLIDDNAIRSSGRLSATWWKSRINKVKNVVAQQTGFYQADHPVSVSKYTEYASMPPALCWGITNVRLGRIPLVVTTDQFDSDAWTSDFPNQPANDSIKVVSSSIADTTKLVTIYGTTVTSDDVKTEVMSLNGTTLVTSARTDWDKILFVALSGSCTGVVTITETTGGKAIATISSSGLNAGYLPAFAVPNSYRIQANRIFFSPIPDADCTVYITGGVLPSDMGLDTDTIANMPLQFEWLISTGAAAEAQGINLYDETGSARNNAYFQQFLAGMQELKNYLNDVDRSSNGSISIPRR